MAVRLALQQVRCVRTLNNERYKTAFPFKQRSKGHKKALNKFPVVRFHKSLTVRPSLASLSCRMRRCSGLAHLASSIITLTSSYCPSTCTRIIQRQSVRSAFLGCSLKGIVSPSLAEYFRVQRPGYNHPVTGEFVYVDDMRAEIVVPKVFDKRVRASTLRLL